jgi:hypothetical protein
MAKKDRARNPLQNGETGKLSKKDVVWVAGQIAELDDEKKFYDLIQDCLKHEHMSLSITFGSKKNPWEFYGELRQAILQLLRDHSYARVEKLEKTLSPFVDLVEPPVKPKEEAAAAPKEDAKPEQAAEVSESA